MQIPFEQIIRLIAREAFVHRIAVVGAFVAISLSAVVVGLAWPKGYTASTTILVEEKNIIQPLMAGAAVATNVTDRAKIAREIIFGRKIMHEVLSYAGWFKANSTDLEQEKIAERVRGRTSIRSIRQNLIQIEYKDEDAERAFKTTQKFADLFIAESLAAQAKESQDAFEFIDKQTREYHDKLVKAEDALKEFRSENIDARPGTESEVGTRINALIAKVDATTQELQEARIKKTSLEKQLSGEAEATVSFSREGQYRARIAELQSQLETLRLTYHDTYPDIVRLNHQIADLRDAIAAEQQRREAAKSQAKASGQTYVDESITLNPLYQQLRRDLSQTKTTIDTLEARLAEAKRQLNVEMERGVRVQTGEATLAELTRDYQVNQAIYQDLLKRRENARVSMNLDRDRQGLSFKIQEPAVLPLQPSGLRFMHFLILGLFAGIVVPVGALFVYHQLDPRVHLPTVISDKLNLPLLAVVPHLSSTADAQLVVRDAKWLALALIGTMVIMVMVSVFRVTGVL